MSDSNEYYDRLANAELERRQAAIDAARADERARIVAALRSRAEHVDRVATRTGPYRSHIFRTLAGAIERGEFGDLAAGDE